MDNGKNDSKITISNFPKEFSVNVKDKHWYTDLKFIIPVAISILSLLFAVGSFSTFNLKTYSAGIYFIKAVRPNENVLSFVAPFEFLNNGSKNGIIENIFYEIQTPNEKGIVYYPRDEINVNNLNKKCSDWRKNPFQAFGIPGKSSITKSIFFTGTTATTTDGGIVNKLFEEGEFIFELYIKTSNDHEAKKVKEWKINISEKMVHDYYYDNKLIFYRFSGDVYDTFPYIDDCKKINE